MGKLLVNAMKDFGELQLHFKKLICKFADLALVSLIGLNANLDSNDDTIKRKTLYSILNDFQVFNDIKDPQTTIIEMPLSEVDEEETKSNQLSPFAQSLIKHLKL